MGLIGAIDQTHDDRPGLRGRKIQNEEDYSRVAIRLQIEQVCRIHDGKRITKNKIV